MVGDKAAFHVTPLEKVLSPASARSSCYTSSLEECALAIGATTPQQDRSREMGTFVQLTVDSARVTLQLNDPEHFNTFSTGLGEDVRHAVQHICSLPSVSSVVLQGAGPHFSVGGNPYAKHGSIGATLASYTLSLRELYSGFLQLRALSHPVTGAVHGALVGASSESW